MDDFREGFMQAFRDWWMTLRYLWWACWFIPFLIGMAIVVVSVYFAYGKKGIFALRWLFSL